MKTVKIERYETMGNGTRSHVHTPNGDLLHGLERSWHGNKPNVSCFPAGIYALLPHVSYKYGNVYAFIGGTVGLKIGPRWGCLIHPANYTNQLQGCLAIGLKCSVQNGLPVVWDSRDACGVLFDDLAGEPAIAVVEWV